MFWPSRRGRAGLGGRGGRRAGVTRESAGELGWVAGVGAGLGAAGELGGMAGSGSAGGLSCSPADPRGAYKYPALLSTSRILRPSVVPSMMRRARTASPTFTSGVPFGSAPSMAVSCGLADFMPMHTKP